MRTRGYPQGGEPEGFASPTLPGASRSAPSPSCSTPSPSTPSLLVRLQPVVLRFSAGAAAEADEADGGSDGVRDRGGRGEEVEERRGERNPE